MAVSSDMIRTWRAPRAVMRSLLAMGQREDRAIAYLMAACFVIFVAQWPRLSRRAAGFEVPEGTEVPEFSQLMAYEFLAWLMIWPLIMYVLAAFIHVVAMALGGKGTWFSTRLALFWTLLATTPAALLSGLTAGFIGPGPETNLAGFIWVVAFLVIGFFCVREAEKAPV